MLLFLFFFGLALGAASPSDDRSLALGAASPSDDLSLALGAVSPSDDPQLMQQQGNCPMFWYSFNGRCYKYVSTRMTWADAELHCVSEGANLVSIHSVEEQNFVKSLIKNFDPAEARTWIGLSDTQKEGRWMWSDGSAANFVFWSNGEPNNQGGVENCVHNNFGPEFRWNDRPCSDVYTFVCASRTICP